MTFQPPLDDAAVLYRAQPWDANNTVLPSEGTRPEPLQLGPTLVSTVQDPDFVADATLGDHLRYPPNGGRYATAAVPVSLLNGDITIAVRWRPEAPFTQRKIIQIIDNYGVSGELKHFYLTCSYDNKYLSRFWEDTPSRPQIHAQGTVPSDPGRTDTVVVTWDATSRTNKLYVNGTLEAATTAPNPRSSAASSPLHVPTPGIVSTHSAGKYFALAVWDRALLSEEVAALTTNPDWLSGGGPPPPPPPPGVLVVMVDGVHYPEAAVLIDGVPVQPPATGEKVVEVLTQG